MAEPFIGEVKIWSLPWAPQYWQFCDGSILPLAQNQALFSLLGTYYGGNGTTTFGLPDLRGRTPVGYQMGAQGAALYNLGAQAGSETVTLSIATVPPHAHTVSAQAANANAPLPTGGSLANVVKVGTPPGDWSIYLPTTNGTVPNPQALIGETVSTDGASAPHNNMQPFTVLSFCIAMTGLYPSRP